jgi:transposase
MTVTMTAPRTRVDPGGMPSPPDPEVPEKAKRRRFSAEYKLAILREADACTEPGQIGALLRRERLYSSHLVDWRRQRETGALEALARKRGPKPADPAQGEADRLRRENERLRGRLAQAERIIEIQGKVSELLGTRSTRPATTSRARPDGRRRRGRARPWRYPGLPGAGDFPGDAVPAPAATGPTSVQPPATAAAAGPVGR